MLHVRLSLEAHFPAGIPVVFPGWQPTRNSSTRSPAWDFGSLLRGVFRRGFFIFLFFIFVFYKNIFLIWKFTRIYPSRPAAGRQGLLCKKFCSNNYAEVPRRPALPPIYKDWLVPHLSFASLKFQKPRKKREGGTEAKPYRIFEPATAGNQNSSTLY